MKKYAIFLDIDGVLCSTRVQLGYTNAKHPMWDKFDPVAIDFLNTLDDTYNIEFILISTWKENLTMDSPMLFHWINSSFRNSGFRGRFAYPHWKTNYENNKDKYNFRIGRAYEVKDYLEEYEYNDFLIFDDSDYDFNKILGIKRWIRTDPADGILSKHMIKVLSLVGQWEKK